MKNNERSTVFGHGFPFLVYKTPAGYNISHEGKWVWRANTISEVNRVVRNFGLKYLRNSI
ncbi:hypothetical protein PHIM7_233 [Sinorhizobium phage phiM7]|uniref:Uncharacterized protein n=1 Tax=Sinorhizobium phage phiM7 TaxID=1647403 RepID=A0A0F6SIN8_9CAUD|nr:hypothetical protein FDH46_gp245 [Sinorhizobium phage phiM7]AKF12778.1 hypothetical protein PHIM7_233 [Sinorhizobium phage phiM7]AKF13139.1 hypothetical protein PHIM19_234 [Sinorhizobium phage phiM19]